MKASRTLLFAGLLLCLLASGCASGHVRPAGVRASLQLPEHFLSPGWTLRKNGLLSEWLHFEACGNCEITVMAKRNLPGNRQAKMRLLFDLQPVGEWDVSSGKFSTYSAEVKVEPGVHHLIIEYVPKTLGPLYREAFNALVSGKLENAISAYTKILEYEPDNYLAHYNLACAYSLSGKKDKALAHLESAILAGFVDFNHIEKDSDLDNIRTHKRYTELMSRKEELKKLGTQNVEKRNRGRDDGSRLLISTVRITALEEGKVPEVEKDCDARMAKCLEELDSLLENFYSWLATLYDPQAGGFYYAASSMTDDRFKPDIESTAQALNILDRAGLIPKLPQRMKKKLIKFFQERQDKETGFFFDPHNDMRERSGLRARAVMYSVGALKRLGARPLYPPPGKNRKVSAYLAHWESPQKYVAWMKSLNLDFAWGAIGDIAEEASMLLNLPKGKREPLIAAGFAFLEEIQAPDGFWGKGKQFVRLSGAFKASAYYWRLGRRKLPRADRMYESLLSCIRKETCDHFCFVRNPISLFPRITAGLAPVPPEERLEIMTITLRNLRKFLRQDGGFSVFPDRSNPAPNSVTLGNGLPEGDLNASTQVITIRTGLYKIAGKEKKPSVYAGRFLDVLKERGLLK